MIERILKAHLLALFAQYPVVTVTGPRQAGKTTLCRSTFPELPYVNLESPDVREFAEDDPRGFLARYGDGAILDEIQRTPELLSYLQAHVDELDRNGIFVVTGSQQLTVSEAISQSLAGRTALLRLLPLSIAELSETRASLATDRLLFTGFYPRIYDRRLDPTQALGDYFETYVERDVRQLGGVRNLSAFQRFVRLCAGRVGQLLNLQSLGNDAGVSHTTAREWLSVLEATYIVFLLPPYHANVSKRLIKTPKLYFYDVGLASCLLGIESERQIFTHPLRGGLFENLVIGEALKHRFNQGRRSNLFFFRNRRGTEVDLLYTLGDTVVGVEVKAGATVAASYFASLDVLTALLPNQVAGRLVVYDGRHDETRHGIVVTSPKGFVSALEHVERGPAPRRSGRR